jgi:hypothetical protein
MQCPLLTAVEVDEVHSMGLAPAADEHSKPQCGACPMKIVFRVWKIADAVSGVIPAGGVEQNNQHPRDFRIDNEVTANVSPDETGVRTNARRPRAD